MRVHMQSGHGSSPRWGLLATVLIHGMLWAGWQLAAWQERPVRALPAPPSASGVLQVQLVARPRPPAAPAPASIAAPAAPDPGAMAAPPPPQPRDAIHYYHPDEVDRELLPRLDPTGELLIDLPQPVVLHLFVDARGRVNAVTIEDTALAPALQEQLRDAFMRMTFLPARRRGQDVAARMRIEVAASAAPPAAPQQPAGPITPR